MTDPEPVLRTLTPEDFPAAVELDGLAFGYDPDRGFLDEVVGPTLEFDRMIGVFDPAGSALLGTTAALTKDLTFPGKGPAAVAAVTWVGVHPGERRRGILRRMMRFQLDQLRASGEAVAILTASDPAIYPRFGYGRSADRVRMSLVAHAAVRHPAGEPDRVTEMMRTQALPIVRARYDAVARTSPGYLSRSDAVWAWLYADHPEAKGGASNLRFAIHPDGFASFRVDLSWGDRGADSTVLVHELCAGTPQARSALWAYLLNLDLTGKVVHRRGWPDDPILDLVANPRGAVDWSSDHIWMRIVDLERAIDLRSYSADVDLVVEITDDFCPWNAGRWRVQLSATGGRVVRSDEPAVIRLDIRDLAAAFLGGTPVARMAAAGCVTGDGTAIDELHDALITRLKPHCPESF